MSKINSGELDRYITGNYGEDMFAETDADYVGEYEPDDPRYDYTNASNQQLASWLRQLRRSKLHLDCEFGHMDCGCSNASNMDGRAPCSLAVQNEIDFRKRMANRR